MAKVTYPDRLIAGMRENKIIPFVGAGVSKKSLPDQFPTWSELAADMNALAVGIRSISRKEFNQVSQLIKDNRLTFAMDVLKGALPQEEFENLLTEKFEYIDLKEANLVTQNLVLKMANGIIITTNYDRLIEDAFARTFRKSPTSVTFEGATTIQYSIQDFRRPKEPIIFKIHGDIQNKASIILSERDYRTLIYDHQTYETVITSMFLNNVFLFIGFSMEDREILYHLERLRHRFSYVTQSHYALMPATQVSDLEVKQFRESYGVEILKFDDENGYGEIDKFLAGAIRRKNRK